ncbi:MAG: carbohydrate kinase, partial [Thermomicrobiales bacterium]|nr:carbohydrate kinase [Thermomicrobiales bacterium]
RFGEEPMFDLGGMALTSQAIGPKILWIQRHEPELYTAAHMFLGSSSYMVYRLTGEYVMDYHTASYYNPLFDLRHLCWDARFAGPIVELDRLPKLMWSDQIAGAVTPAAAAETGLKVGTPVTAGTIDAAAEAVSVGVVDPGDMMVMYGTTMFFIHVTGDPVPDPRMWATAFALPGRYSVDGGMSTTGALTRWFRDNLAGEEMATEAAGGSNAYAALAEAAGRIPPGAEGVICLPYFAGERTPINDPDARGVYAGLTLSHTKAHLYRASLEGTAYGVRHNLETMSAMGAPPRRLVAVGGGAKNPLWLQIVSDVSGLPQDVPERTIGASYGDAFMAGLATGIVSGPDALERDCVSPQRAAVSRRVFLRNEFAGSRGVSWWFADTRFFACGLRMTPNLGHSTRDDTMFALALLAVTVRPRPVPELHRPGGRLIAEVRRCRARGLEGSRRSGRLPLRTEKP